MVTRCYEFVDTLVAETCGSEVLDLRAIPDFRTLDQSSGLYSLPGMETPLGAILGPPYIGTVFPESVTSLESALAQ